MFISPYVDKAKLLSSTQRSTAVFKADVDSGLKIPLQLEFSSGPLPPQTPHSSSTASPPQTPLQSAITSLF